MSLSTSSDGAIFNARSGIRNPGLARRLGCADDGRGTLGIGQLGRGTVGSRNLWGLENEPA